MIKEIRGNIEFKEEQRFHQPWFWILILSPVLVSIIVTVAMSVNTFEHNNEGLLSLAIVVPVNLLMLYLFFITRFEIVVTDEAVYYKWPPFNRKFRCIARADIFEVRVRKSPLLQLGYKRVIGYGRVHNLGAAKGLQFVLRSGRKIFISSEKINSFQQAVEKLAPVSLK
jgi:hypothetical protein